MLPCNVILAHLQGIHKNRNPLVNRGHATKRENDTPHHRPYRGQHEKYNNEIRVGSGVVMYSFCSSFRFFGVSTAAAAAAVVSGRPQKGLRKNCREKNAPVVTSTEQPRRLFLSSRHGGEGGRPFLVYCCAPPRASTTKYLFLFFSTYFVSYESRHFFSAC